MEITLRMATPADVPLLLEFIRELAEYEKLAHHVVATEELLRQTLFPRDRTIAEAVLAYGDAAPAGFVIFFHSYSTFMGRPGLYVEDLYVRPAYRQRGIGRALLGYTAHLARERNCGRLEWTVLDWNEPAIRFYEKLGARSMDEWRVFRVYGESLNRLADTAVHRAS